MLSLNIGSVLVLSLTVPLALAATLLFAGVDENWATAISVTTFFMLSNWLLAGVKCPHCRRLLSPGALPIVHVFFWQRYFYFGGRCPHCGRVAESWWY